MKAVILAGGVGTRLWPLSRKQKPKQFQKLTSDLTMLQETYERVKHLGDENIYIATNEDFFEDIIAQLPQISHDNIILEPALRDTATCIGYAAMRLSIGAEPGEVMAIIYADHLVKDPDQFRAKLEVAEKVARDERTLNIIEVKARFPNVNLGWVKVGKPLDKVDGHEVQEFKGFTEKPDLKKAKKFMSDGDYLWNTGMYVWRIDTILEKYKKHMPETYEKLMKIKDSIGTDKEEVQVRENYIECEKISIDYAIMEKVSEGEVRIIPADFGWSDVGTWESIHDELAIDRDDNIVQGNHIGIDTNGSVVRTDNPNKIIATIGLEDIVVVDTPDALLICPKKRSQDVKKMVEKLKEEGKYL
ncbi:mannose-1-phosphate guanylyltransferase [Patescibacteria group bacterium]